MVGETRCGWGGRLHGFSHLPGPGPAPSKTRGPLVLITGRSKACPSCQPAYGPLIMLGPRPGRPPAKPAPPTSSAKYRSCSPPMLYKAVVWKAEAKGDRDDDNQGGRLGATLSLLLTVGLLIVLPTTARLSGWGEHEKDSIPKPVAPTETYSSVRWAFQGYECADGWPSQSIGKRGACSHHGGVISVFRGTDGTVLRCGRDEHPPRAHEQRRQMADYGSLMCTFG